MMLSLAACRPGASEPAEDHATRVEDRHHQTHHIIESDHRHVIPLRRDDRIVLPSDPAFDWHVELEDRSAFARVVGEDAGEAYRVTKAGPFRMMVFGEPKCLRNDGGCGLSRRRWDVTVTVQ
jgi:hypothetical protein